MTGTATRLAVLLVAWIAAGIGLVPSGAAAQSASTPPEAAPPDANADPWQGNLLGDAGGLRPALDNHGISFGLQSSNEVFGNAAGGIQRGAEANGITMLSVVLDTGKAIGLAGGTLNLSGLWIYGPDFTQGYTDSLQTVSSLTGQPTVRLWEFWYQQTFLAGRLDIKLGQQSVDQEFMTSEGGSLFLNATMGWPAPPSADLYAGGPGSPLSSLGVRLRFRPIDALTVLAGVFDDNPPGGALQNDSQLRGAERYGALFNLSTGALAIVELQYAANPVLPGAGAGLPGTYKLGAWLDSARFADQRFDNAGLPLANPASNGAPRWHRHDYGIYAVIDQTIWQPDPKGPRAIAVFARPSWTPADRNLVDFSLDTGVTIKAPFPGRDGDSFGIGVGIAHVSANAGALDRDSIAFSGIEQPIRSAETFIEVTYQAQVTPWLQVQPDFQYFRRPGGGLPSPNDPSTRIGDAAVFGVRTVAVF